MKAIIFLADGFEECEALIVVDILRRARIETTMVSVSRQIEVNSSRHIIVKADAIAEEIDCSTADLIVLPGGRLGVENLKKSSTVRKTVTEFAVKKKVAAICAAPVILAKLSLLNGKKVSCHPDYEEQMYGSSITHESVTVDGNIITGQGLGATFDFAFEIVKALIGKDKVDEIKKAICYKN